MARIVVLQRQVSQLDEPVYARMHEMEPGSVAVIYWNDYGFSRTQHDPETGVVPDFSETMTHFPKEWIDSRCGTVAEVVASIASKKPALVVVSDIPNQLRLQVATELRWRGLKVGLRTDKNSFSKTANTGWKLTVERHLTSCLYDVLAPASPLTSTYYAWPPARQSLLFPYTTNERKFCPNETARNRTRQQMRNRLGIAEQHYVFLAASKFVERENPWGVIRCFERLASERDDVSLIALGDGEQREEIKNYCRSRGLLSADFPGFVPFRDLQNYFFAADAFLHLAAIEPWGVSPQDALLAGLGVLVTDHVGCGRVFLEGELSRFLVSFGDEDEIVSRMRELATIRTGRNFDSARMKAAEYTVSSCANRLLDT